jgi:hypothetical protein
MDVSYALAPDCQQYLAKNADGCRRHANTGVKFPRLKMSNPPDAVRGTG